MMKSNAYPVNGLYREYFADGTLSAQGRFKNGKRHGLWKYYYRNAVRKAVGKYVSGEFEASGSGGGRTASACRPESSEMGNRSVTGSATTITVSSGMRAFTRAA
jgi:hypothetical protein